MADVVVFDLEATCWPGRRSRREEMETIEIGAVRLGPDLGPLGDEFSMFVRPVRNPVLSDFCVRLTSISQSDVDAAREFPEVLEEFVDWARPQSLSALCSWGDYDVKQLCRDCRYHGLEGPSWLVGGHPQHVNVRREYADVYNGGRLCTVPEAVGHLGLSFEGTLHRGVDDARNIAAVLAAMRRRPSV